MSENPYQPPTSESGDQPARAGGGGDFGAELAGDDLVISKDAEFPDVCLKCGSRDVHARQQHTFQYNPPYVIPMVVLCTMPGVILMLIVRKTAKMLIPLCGECDARWRAAKAWTIAAIVILLAAIAFPYVLREPGLLLIGFLLGLGAFLGILLGVVNPALLRARRIDAEKITIVGVHERAARYIVKQAKRER